LFLSPSKFCFKFVSQQNYLILSHFLLKMRSSQLVLGLLAISLPRVALSVQVVFPLTLTWEKGAPDGFERYQIFMNGEFPGPKLELNEGDDAEVCRTKQEWRGL
jgi:hypothetical protein